MTCPHASLGIRESSFIRGFGCRFLALCCNLWESSLEKLETCKMKLSRRIRFKNFRNLST